MGAITAEKLSAIYSAFNTKFVNGMQRGRLATVSGSNMAQYLCKFKDVAMNVQSTTAEELHTWITQIPGFTEWVGDRVAQTLGVSGLRVVNKDYAQTVEIDRNKILDDIYAIFGSTFENMGAEGSDDAFWLDLMILALQSTEKWADDVDFFTADRKFGDQTIDNVIDGNLTQANLKASVNKMLGYKGNNGLPLNVTPFMVLCGSTAFWTAKKYLENDRIVDDNGDPVDNETKGIATPRWHYGLPENAWYVLGIKSSFMPLAAQRRQEASALVTNVNPTDPNVFWQKKFVYGTDLRGAGFRPFPFLIVRGNSGVAPQAPAPSAQAQDDDDKKKGSKSKDK